MYVMCMRMCMCMGMGMGIGMGMGMGMGMHTPPCGYICGCHACMHACPP